MQSQKRSHSDGFAVFPPHWPLVVPRGTPSLSQGSFATFEGVLGLHRALRLEGGGGGQVDSLLQAGHEEAVLPNVRMALEVGQWEHRKEPRPPGFPMTSLVLLSCTTASTDSPAPLFPFS